MDIADRAERAQQRLNDQAIASRKPPMSVQRPNVECRDCGETNDRPEYAICSACLAVHHPDMPLA